MQGDVQQFDFVAVVSGQLGLANCSSLISSFRPVLQNECLNDCARSNCHIFVLIYLLHARVLLSYVALLCKKPHFACKRPASSLPLGCSCCYVHNSVLELRPLVAAGKTTGAANGVAHSHEHGGGEHGHTHEHMEHPGRYTERDQPIFRSDWKKVSVVPCTYARNLQLAELSAVYSRQLQTCGHND